jgi:hypothetical protein
MGRTDPDFSTDRQRNSMFDVCEVTCPSTIGDQLRNQGYTRPNMPQGNQGQVRVEPRYPLAGNAGFDTDNDADDYNTAAYGQPASTTSSSGPP